MMPHMDLQRELRYDAGVDAVYAMLCDKDFREQVCEATLAKSYEVSIDAAGDTASVRVSRALEAPDIAKKFVGDTMDVVQTERWQAPDADGTRRADLEVVIPGKPGAMKGTVVLAPDGDGSVETISGDVKVKIPLVGGKVEKEIARGIVAGIKAEGQVGRDWLAG